GAVTSSLGSFENMSFVISRAVPRDQEVEVWTTVMHPGDPSRQVNWIVGMVNGAPKILDILGEGSSLRIVERDDCTSFLVRNENNIQALISRLLQQAAEPVP